MPKLNDTCITLRIGDRTMEARLPYPDCDGSELVELFCALMIGQTFYPTVIIQSLKTTLETYEDSSN